MTIRKMFGTLVLLCATLCQGCAGSTYQPAPLPPETETVAVYRDLPPNLLQPCDRPDVDPAAISTDVDLLGLAQRAFHVLDNCAGQVDAIRAIYQVKMPAGKIDEQ